MPMETSSVNPPDYFPQSISPHAYEWEPFANGTRMNIHRGKKDQCADTVLRVPRKTEHELNGNDILSDITRRDIAWQETLKRYLGNNMEEVFPFLSQDARGKSRAYSIQRMIHPKAEISHCFGSPCRELGETALESFAKLIEGTRKLILEQKIIPDLVGIGNVVLTDDDRVVLVDINNLRPILLGLDFLKSPNEETANNVLKEILDQRKDPKSIVAHGYLDENENPIGDISLRLLRSWELYLEEVKGSREVGARDLKTIQQDPMYEMFGSNSENPVAKLRGTIFNIIQSADSPLNLA